MSSSETSPAKHPPNRSMLSVEDALQKIAELLPEPGGSESVAVMESLGRVIADDVRSPIDVPGHDNSAMDGYGIRHSDITTDPAAPLKVIGQAFAGAPFQGSVGRGEAVRIMTGAVIPDGVDTVVMQEQTESRGESITISGEHPRGAHVRHAGDDLIKDSVVVEKGKRLYPAELGLLASLGIAKVKVIRRLRVATFSTGDELRGVGEPLAKGEIYDSNRYTLQGLLRRLGAEIIDLGVIRDQREAVIEAFRSASQQADVTITSGGVSVGDADYVKESLELLGSVDFWKIAMKPGKPLAFGRIGNSLFFGLPGNPVSVLATFYEIVQPSLRRMMGEHHTLPLSITVPCAENLPKAPGRRDYQRGILEQDRGGQLIVRSTGDQGSHILSSMSQANCFIVLPAEWGDVEAGTAVEVQPFEGLI